jgi:hypothetical protein
MNKQNVVVFSVCGAKSELNVTMYRVQLRSVGFKELVGNRAMEDVDLWKCCCN